MAQFISLEEAAERLGISKDRLSELRDEGKVRGFRDGGGWKFKDDEIERFAGELAAGNFSDDDGDSIDLNIDDDLDTGADSILLSERELGESGKGPSSTVIGKTGGDGEDSDVQLSAGRGKKPVGDSQVTLDDTGLSDVQLSSTSDVLSNEATSPGSKGSGPSAFEGLDELELDLESESKIISSGTRGAAGSDLSITSDSGIELGAEDSGVGSGKPGSGGKPGSKSGSKSGLRKSGSSKRNKQDAGASGFDLAIDEDDEFVLGESSGSDITISSEDSGIGLATPADSGLSLDEEPLELGGSTVESLELGEDEEISLDMEGDSEAATQLKADDDFLLTPLDEAGEDADDSGSQVIALDSESFDEAADTMLGGQAGAAAAMADQLGDMGTATLGGAGAASALAPAPVSAPEAPYSIWNVLSLAVCLMLLGLAGMMMYDLLRNMWSWDQPYALNSSIMDGLMEMLPIDK